MMAQMTQELARRVAAIRADTRSGAVDLTREAVGILTDAYRHERSVVVAAAALCAAQPAMAPIWNASAIALRPDGIDALARYQQLLQRAPAALARVAVEVLLADRAAGEPMSVVTVSASHSVRRCLLLLSRRSRLHVLCAEGRPLFEGRELAVALAREGIATTVCTDAAVTSLSPSARAVLVGADAVAGDWFINKCGTHQVVTVAATQGVPAYVVASRDKFVHPLLGPHLRLSGGVETEVWIDHPPEIAVANPYFERVPIDSLAGVLTDIGPVGSGSLHAATGGVVTSDDVRRLLSASIII